MRYVLILGCFECQMMCPRSGSSLRKTFFCFLPETFVIHVPSCSGWGTSTSWSGPVCIVSVCPATGPDVCLRVGVGTGTTGIELRFADPDHGLMLPIPIPNPPSVLTPRCSHSPATDRESDAGRRLCRVPLPLGLPLEVAEVVLSPIAVVIAVFVLAFVAPCLCLCSW